MDGWSGQGTLSIDEIASGKMPRHNTDPVEFVQSLISEIIAAIEKLRNQKEISAAVKATCLDFVSRLVPQFSKLLAEVNA